MTVYNLDPSISLDELYHSFVTFGDVKDIRDLPGRVNSKVIEFYDGALAIHRCLRACLHRVLGHCLPRIVDWPTASWPG